MRRYLGVLREVRLCVLRGVRLSALREPLLGALREPLLGVLREVRLVELVRGVEPFPCGGLVDKLLLVRFNCRKRFMSAVMGFTAACVEPFRSFLSGERLQSRLLVGRLVVKIKPRCCLVPNILLVILNIHQSTTC